jgi:hypothetical protein
MPPNRALTLIVIVMGVMIVGGLAVLGVTIAARMAHPARHAGASASTSVDSGSSGSPPRPFVAPPIDVPAGAHVEAIGAGPSRAVVAVALPDGSRRLLIIDLATGRELGQVPLRPASSGLVR